MGHGLRILKADLSRLEAMAFDLPHTVLRDYLGGSGLAIYLLRTISAAQEPMVFAPGLLVGYPVLAGCKTSVMGRSPLTGLLGEASVSARWGLYLKRLGYDALVLTGRAPYPVILRVETDGIGFDRADGLTGTDIPEYDARHRKLYGDKYEPARVAAAAERRVKVAGIAFDEAFPRYAARCGLGALMASKGVKGISTLRVSTGCEPSRRLVDMNRGLAPEIRERTKGLAGGGTAGGVEFRNAVGDLPVKNWKEGVWDGASAVNGWTILAGMAGKSRPCFTCPIGCAKVVTLPKGLLSGREVRAPEYETMAGFGPNCLCNDPVTIVEANAHCDRLGLDTISVSSMIAFVMELYERGILTTDMLGDSLAGRGIAPIWGDRKAILSLIDAIATREGIGGLLAEGIDEAARFFGPEAERCAVHVRGLDLPYHDPRCYMSVGVTYATSARGASHNESLAYYVEQGIDLPELGLATPSDPQDPEGKGRIASEMQNLAVLFDATGLCKFLIAGRIALGAMAGWLSAGPGVDFSTDELHTAAERIVTAKRLYAMEVCGYRPEEDTLPVRVQHEPRPSGEARGRVVPLSVLLSDYYRLRGFDDKGYPTGETLNRLGLQKLSGE